MGTTCTSDGCCRVIQQCAFVPIGSNDEIEIEEVTVMMTAALLRVLLLGIDLKMAEAVCRSRTGLLGKVSHVMLLRRTGSYCTGVKCGGDRSVRRMKKEQTQRRKRGGLDTQPSADCWIKKNSASEVHRSHKRIERGTEEKKEALVVSERLLDWEGLEEDVQTLSCAKTTER